MGPKRFQSNPYPGLQLTELDREKLLEIANTLVEENFHKYEQYEVQDKRKVDESCWKYLKSKDDLHIYVDRESIGQQYLSTSSSMQRKTSRATQVNNAAPKERKLIEQLSVGTFVGQFDDVMFGIVNPTQDIMRMKASYVDDFQDGAVLATIIKPTTEDPYRTVLVKWVQLDVPLGSTNLIKNRDYVFLEATGILHFANGDRVGYHLMHSLNFPQAPPLPNRVRASLSICGLFRQISANSVDNFATCTTNPGSNVPIFLQLAVSAQALLSATNYVYCGHTKKLSWILQKRQASHRANPRERNSEVCVNCARKLSGKGLGTLGKGVCRICFGCVCRSCRVPKRVSFITPDSQLIQRKIDFCAMCVSETTKMNAVDAARDQAEGFGAYDAFDSSSSDTASESSYRFSHR